MSPRTCQIEALDRGRVARPARDRPHEQDLIQGQIALVEMTLSEAEPRFDVPGAEHLPIDDRAGEIRRIARERLDHPVAERLACFRVPLTLPKSIRRVLHPDRHHMLPTRRKARVHQ